MGTQNCESKYIHLRSRSPYVKSFWRSPHGLPVGQVSKLYNEEIVYEVLSKLSIMDIFKLSSKECDLDHLVNFTQCHIIFKVSPQATFWPGFITILSINSVWDIVKNYHKWIFPDFQVNLWPWKIISQGHPISNHFEGIPTGYLLVKFHNSTTKK